MTLICPVCSAKNSTDITFCQDCGSELGNDIQSDSSSYRQESSIESENKVEILDGQNVSSISTQNEQISQSENTFATAKLIAKSPNSPIKEFILEESPLLVGKFDPETGPVDIDLEKFPDAEYISKTHAEIFYENGSWKVKDLDSTNGVFLRKIGEASRDKVVNQAIVLNSGIQVFFGKICFIFQGENIN